MSLNLTANENVALLTLNDGKGNTFNPAMLARLEAVLPELAEAGAVVITGRAGMFSGGLDLKVLPTLSTEERVAMLEQFCRVMMGFFELPRPVIAAVSGHAIAGGAILGLTADLRIFAEGSYRFALLEVPLGIPLPGFAMEMAKLAVSGSTLTELALHGRSFNPEESVKGGLGVELVGGELLVERSMERARGLAKLPGAYGSSKRRLWAEAYRRGWEAIGREGMMFLGAVDEVLSRKDAERQRGQQ